MDLDLRYEERTAVLTLEHAPVNALCLGLRRALVAAFATLGTDAAIDAIVIRGAGNGFCAGGDRKEFGTTAANERPTLSRDVLGAVRACGKPAIAAMHGFAVGGGLELALACNARVAVADTRLGLPEVNIGVFPLSGTQRLPRLVGLERAADLIMTGALDRADSGAMAGVIDRIVATFEDLLPVALQVARRCASERAPGAGERPFPDPDPRATLARILQRYPAATCSPPQRAALEAITAAVQAPDFQSGLDQAQLLFDALGGNRRPQHGPT